MPALYRASPASDTRAVRPAVSALVTLLVGGALIAAASSAATPATLLASLRAAAYPDTALPADYSSAAPGSSAFLSDSRAHGALASVELDVDGPDQSAGIVFVVFKSAAGAHADLAVSALGGSGMTLAGAGKVAGVPSSAVFRGSLVQTDALNDATSDGVAVAEAAQGNVLVVGFTYSVLKIGNLHGALTLLRSGMSHLQKISAGG